jgi:transposase
MITKIHARRNSSTKDLIVAFDVGKANLDLYYEIPHESGTTFEATAGQIPNKPTNIIALLDQLAQTAKDNGYEGLIIVCESTGVYSNKLLSIAKQKGHRTAYVSGESVHKLKVLENNDSGKTDTKDPRVILMIAKMDKTLKHRPLAGLYLILRELNCAYAEEREQMTSIKGQCHPILARLFCDLNFCAQFLYETTGNALYTLYRYNPKRILEQGQVRFVKAMKKLAPGVRNETLQKLWDNAKTSCLLVQDDGVMQAMEYRLEGLWERLIQATRRISEIETKMSLIYAQLVELGEKIPQASPEFLSPFRIARILGETGPLSDFPNIECLTKFAGLNLRERKSGQYTGGVHLSKKGRSGLRDILGQTAFGMVKKGRVFGDYYHRKKDQGMVGTKILVAVERKLLETVYTMATKCVAFDLNRLNHCESQLAKAA